MKLALPVFVILVLSVAVFAASYCSTLEQYQKKAEYYREILNSPEKLAALNMSSEQIARVVNSLSTSLEKAEQLCEREKAAASAQTTDADSKTSANAQETSGSSAASSRAAATRTATANTENANENAIDARQKAADTRSETANARLNITGIDTTSAREIMAKYNTTDTAAIARIVNARTAESGASATIDTASGTVSDTSATAPTTETLARFAYWWGKVTMVQSTSGGWEPAENMRDGANINPLTYCQQLNSRSEGVRELGKTRISGWINRDGKEDSQGRASYTESGVVYECLPYRAFEVKTQLNPNVPLFTAPSDGTGESETATQATGRRLPEALRAAESSDEIIAPTGTTAAGDVSDYYKQKMQVILQKSDNVDAQITSLKRLSGEINRLITSLLEKKSRIAMNEEGMKELVEKVKVTSTTVSSGSVEVPSTGKIIEARMNAKKAVEVEAREGSVVLRDNGVEAHASEVSVTSDTVSVGGSDVNITPSEIAKKVNAVSRKISIATAANKKAVYSVDAQTKAKILGILPVTMQHTVEINAQDGSTISDSKPWWGAVAVEDEAQPPATESASTPAESAAQTAESGS